MGLTDYKLLKTNKNEKVKKLAIGTLRDFYAYTRIFFGLFSGGATGSPALYLNICPYGAPFRL